MEEPLSDQYLRMEGFQKHMLLHRNRDALTDRLLLQVQQDLTDIRRSLNLLKIAVRAIPVRDLINKMADLEVSQ